MKGFSFLLMALLFINSINAQLQPGKIAPDVQLPNAKDSLVSLSSYKGKVVLIDFWASWCGPCRKSNPEVVRLYKKYKGKGLEVFGISLDEEKKEWLKAVKKDKITYVQVNDNKGMESTTAEKYGVFAIPTTFLIDKDGMIIAVDAEGKELENLVKELLGH